MSAVRHGSAGIEDELIVGCLVLHFYYFYANLRVYQMGNENDNLVKKNPPEISGRFKIITPSVKVKNYQK